MADIELVIKIPEYMFEDIQDRYKHPNKGNGINLLEYAVANGTPLDKHDEEVIAETVESIWGKPPYRDILEKIRDEILKLDDPDYDFEGYYKAVTDTLKIIDKYKAEKENEEEQCGK